MSKRIWRSRAFSTAGSLAVRVSTSMRLPVMSETSIESATLEFGVSLVKTALNTLSRRMSSMSSQSPKNI